MGAYASTTVIELLELGASLEIDAGSYASSTMATIIDALHSDATLKVNGIGSYASATTKQLIVRARGKKVVFGF